MFRVADKIHVQNPVCVQLLDNVSWCHTHGWYEQLSVALDNNVDELVEESKASALELVETLKAEGKLDGPSSGLKRTHEESNAMVALIEPARIEPRTRRYISLAGALALGAATCVHAPGCRADPRSFAAPYFFS